MDYKKIFKENWMIIGIMSITLILMIYFFIISFGQASWWDSGSYLSQGLHYLNGWNGIHDSYMINFQRPPAFQYIIALMLGIGLSEPYIIFFLCLIPAWIYVFLVYLLGKEMFNKNIGLIAAFLMGINWNWLFWSNRVQPDLIGMCIQMLSMLFFIKYINSKGNPKWNMFLAGALAAASFNFKISGLLVPMIMFIYLLTTQRLNMFKKKENWMFVLGFTLLILPYLIWAWVSFGNPFIIRSGYKSFAENDDPLGWNMLHWFYTFLGDFIFFGIFLAGIIWLSWDIFSKLDLELKQPSQEFYGKWFILLTIIVTCCFYIFYIGGTGTEDRWVFILLPCILYLSAKIISWLYDMLYIKIHKIVALCVIIGLLLFLSYGQIIHADALIKNKVTSYLPVKEAALWMKQNSVPTDGIMSISYEQTFFYSERPTYTYSQMNVSQFEEFYKKNKIAFLTVSVFEPHPSWIYTWIQNNSKIYPVMGYFSDPPYNTQPTLIIYRFNYN